MTAPNTAAIARLRELLTRMELAFPDHTDAQLRICSILISDRAAVLRSLLDQLDSQAVEIERAKRTSALVSINQPVVTQAQIDHEEELARLAAGRDS